MAKNTVQSVEPNIADLVNGWLKSYKVDYKLEQESLNTEIDQALNDYFSKNGGKGGNRPDAKLLLQANDGKYYPILIEYKGYKDKLVKLDAEGNVANRNAKNQPDYQTRDFTVLSDAYAIRWKSEEIELSPNQYLFMVMCINKVTDLPIYSYKNKLGGWNVVKTKEIRLPEKNGKIDFAFMDTFISAIKKLAIKEVVLYSDRKIAATKELVSKNNQLNS